MNYLSWIYVPLPITLHLSAFQTICTGRKPLTHKPNKLNIQACATSPTTKRLPPLGWNVVALLQGKASDITQGAGRK